MSLFANSGWSETEWDVLSFNSEKGGDSPIILMNTDGEILQKLATDPGKPSNFTWSPNGRSIVYDSWHGGNFDIYVMDVEANTHRQLTFDGSRDQLPAWSPNGKWIAFVSDRAGGASVYRMDVNGENVKRLTNKKDCRRPAWSPDSQWIAFDNVVRTSRTHVVNLRTRTVEPLLPELHFVILNVEWSPDGKQLAFAGMECVENQACRLKGFDDLTVYVVNTDGTGLQQVVVKEDFGADYPVWSPQGNALLYQQKVKVILGNFEETQLFRRILGSDKSKQLTGISRNLYADWFDPAYALPVSPQTQLLTTQWGGIKKE